MEHLLKMKRANIKFLALVKWLSEGGAEQLETLQALRTYLDWNRNGLQKLADKLFYFQSSLSALKSPMFQVEVALNVLATGTYQGLPAALDRIQAPMPLTKEDELMVASAMARITRLELMRCRFDEKLRKRLSIGTSLIFVRLLISI